MIGVPVNGAADEVALLMLSTLIAPAGIAMTVLSPRVLASEVVERLRSTPGSILCLGDLPPSPPTRARYLVKKFRSALPDLPIVVGRWAPPDLADLDHGPAAGGGRHPGGIDACRNAPAGHGTGRGGGAQARRGLNSRRRSTGASPWRLLVADAEREVVAEADREHAVARRLLSGRRCRDRACSRCRSSRSWQRTTRPRESRTAC